MNWQNKIVLVEKEKKYILLAKMYDRTFFSAAKLSECNWRVGTALNELWLQMPPRLRAPHPLLVHPPSDPAVSTLNIDYHHALPSIHHHHLWLWWHHYCQPSIHHCHKQWWHLHLKHRQRRNVINNGDIIILNIAKGEMSPLVTHQSSLLFTSMPILTFISW